MIYSKIALFFPLSESVNLCIWEWGEGFLSSGRLSCLALTLTLCHPIVPPADCTTSIAGAYLAKRRTANHPCPVCGKHYVNEGSLRKHLACHPETSQISSLRMWPCSVCNAVFTHEGGKSISILIKLNIHLDSSQIFHLFFRFQAYSPIWNTWGWIQNINLQRSMFLVEQLPKGEKGNYLPVPV